MKSRPKNFRMVLALVGDSTTTNVFPPPETAPLDLSADFSADLPAVFDFAATFAFDFSDSLSTVVVHRDAPHYLHLKWSLLYI